MPVQYSCPAGRAFDKDAWHQPNCCKTDVQVTTLTPVMQEMFLNLRRGMDNELDNIVTVLAKRSGEVTHPTV